MRTRHTVEFDKQLRITSLPQEGVRICLNPMERTLYQLFIAHPEGIQADSLPAYWEELCSIYEQESWFSEKPLRECGIMRKSMCLSIDIL